MTSFYIVPPRKTQLGDNGISISGTLGVITTNPGGAAITGVGALKLDATYSPTWTGTHTFTQPVIFSGSQTISSTLISASGQTAGDLFYYTGTSWSRLAVGSNNQILQSFGGGIGWTGGVNLSNVITGNLKIGSLSGVLKASSGVVSGNSGIGDLSNVLLNLPASGNFLKYNGTKWVNSPIPLSDHNIIIRFLNGYTPAQTGIDIEAATVPYEPSDGTTVLEYTITRIVLQAEIAGSTSSQVTIERALNGQEFDDPMTLGNTIETLTLTSGSYQASSNGPFFKIYSGERLRLNINSIGTGAQQWTVQIEGTAGNPYNGTNAGITSINSLAAQLQTMVVGSGGTDFNISSVIDTHTFNIPSASGSNRGLVTTTNQTFAGIKTFNNTSVTTSTTTGSVIISGGVGIGESIYIGGNVVVGNNLILNNALGLTYGGTGLTTIGESNTFLAVNNAGSSLEYKKLIAGTGITFNFSGSEIILESTGGIGGTVISGGGGISSLSGISYINYPEQSFATGSSGTDFNIVSIGSTHTFNIPVAGSGSSGIVTTNSQIFAGIKTFNNNLIAQSDFNVSGSSNLTSAVGVSSEVNISGGLGVTGASILRSTLQVSGITTIFNSTNTSSTTAGALVVSGGVGISGVLFVGSGANISSNNVSSTTTSSGLVFRANSLTTGTGAYFASNSLTTGKLLDIAVSGNTAIGGRIGINVAVSGVNANTGVTTYGIFTNNISTNTATNIGLGTFANGDSYNIPLRLGLSTNKYINFFINSEGNGLTLSPTGNGSPFLALGGYSGVTAELRLLQSGGFGSVRYVALKAPVTMTDTYELIFPNSYPASSNMTLVGTGTTQVTLSWSSLSSGGIGGTINAGDQYKLAFYVNPNGSSILDDAQALTYSTSGANLTINSTAASVVPLKLIGAVSQTADLLQVATSSSNIFTIDKDGIGNFTNNLIISSNTSSTSSSTGALTVTGGVGVSGNIYAGSNININNAANIGSGLGVSGNTNISGGLGVTGSSLFRSSVVIQDGGLGVTGATLLNSSLTVSGSSILNSTLNVAGNTNIASDVNIGGATNISGLGVSNNINITGGLGVTGTSLFRNTLTVQSGGLGVTGGMMISQGGLGVTGAAFFSSSISAGSLVLTTALPITSGGTGLGAAGTANYILGMNVAGNALEYKQLVEGTNITISQTSGTITISASGAGGGGGSGTVNNGNVGQVAFYSTTGTTVSGNTFLYIGSVGVGISATTQSTSSTTGGLIVVGGLGVGGNLNVGTGLTVSGAVGFSSTLSVSGAVNASSTLGVLGSGNFAAGLGVTGQSIFRNNIEIQSGGLGVTGAVNISSTLGVQGSGNFSGGLGVTGAINATSTLGVQGSGNFAGGLGVTGAVNFASTLGVQGTTNFAGGLGVTGQSIFRNNIEIQSGGLGVTGAVNVTSTLGVQGSINGNSGLGITGSSLFRGNVELSSGLGVTGGIVIYTGGLGVTGAVNVTSTLGVQGSGNFGSGLGVTGAVNITSTISAQGSANFASGLGVTGQSVFRNNIEIQSGGLGVTGAVNVSSTLGVQGSGNFGSGLGVTGAVNISSTLGVQGSGNFSGGLGVTGAVNISSTLGVQGSGNFSGGLGVTGQSIFRNNIEIQSGGLGVTGAANISSTLGVHGSGNFGSGLGVTGSSLFRGNVAFDSGLGVTGQSIFRNNVEIQSGGLGVTGAAVFNSSISAGSLSLSTALPLSSGGTGLGSTSLANHVLGMNNSSLDLEYKQIIEGSNITITHNANSITIAAASSSATPGGPNSAIQYNSSNTLAGASAFLWDNASQRIDIKNTNAIGTGTTTSFLLQNSTASTVSVQMQFSPAIEQIGRAWKTSGSPATDTLVRYLQIVEVTSGATPTGAITWKSAIHNASNQGPTYVKRAEISTNYGLGIYETTGVYKSSIINSASATTDIYYTLPAALPSLNQALTVTGISVSSVTLSWISNGTVASGASGALAYYSGTGTTVDDATGLAYASSGTHLIITSQNATDVPLKVDGHASSSVNLFQVRKGTSDQLVINSNGDVSIASSVDSTSSTSGALIVTGGVGIGGTLNVGANLSISGLTTLTYTSEKLNTKTSATGTVTHDLSSGSIFYHSSISSNFTANFTNVPTTNDRAVGVTLILAQGVTPYMSTALQIDGSAQTIKWVNNTTPTGTASKVDIVGFSLIRTGSAWTVLGQYFTYG